MCQLIQLGDTDNCAMCTIVIDEEVTSETKMPPVWGDIELHLVKNEKVPDELL